jgi:hypothetical protein
MMKKRYPACLPGSANPALQPCFSITPATLVMV